MHSNLSVMKHRNWYDDCDDDLQRTNPSTEYWVERCRSSN